MSDNNFYDKNFIAYFDILNILNFEKYLKSKNKILFLIFKKSDN